MAFALKLPIFEGIPLRGRGFLYTALCFAAGAISSLSMAPANQWVLLFAGLSIFYFILAQIQSKKMAFFSGWFFAFGYFLFSLSWIGNALLVENNPYAWAWPLAVAGLPFVLAFFPALACLMAWRFSDLRSASGYFSFSAFFILFEWLRGHVFSGFPWNLYGYTWADILPVVQFVSIGNIYILTWLTILWGMLPGFLLVSQANRKQKILLAGLLILIFAACFFYGAWRLKHYVPEYHQNIRIKIIQPNIPQEAKWNRDKMAENFFKHIRLSYPHDDSNATTYIVWPETALSYWYTQDKTAMGVLSQALQSYGGQTYLMTGLLRHTAETGAYFNSLVMIDRTGQIDNIYDKHHLVPFGEYIPLQKWIPLKPVAQFTGFIKGDRPGNLTTKEGLRYSPLICYEAIFPGAVIDRQDARPDFMVNVTNDGWYGDSAGPHQHYTNALFRAVEEGIPLIRSANTGFSALIDPMGRALYKSELLSESAKTVKLPKKIAVFQKSIYFENAFLIISVLFITFLAYSRKNKIAN